MIAVSSTLHHLGSNKRLLQGGYRGPDPGHMFSASVYGDSKLACVHFVEEFARRFRGTGVTANALHPGCVRTSIYAKGTSMVDTFLSCGLYLWGKTAAEGAQTTLHLVLADDVDGVSGEYFADCYPAWTSSSASDEKVRRDFWELSCRLTGLPSNLTKNGLTKNAESEKSSVTNTR